MKLRKHYNNKKRVSSYTISISIKEAKELNWIDENGEGKELQKEIINNYLIIKEA